MDSCKDTALQSAVLIGDSSVTTALRWRQLRAASFSVQTLKPKDIHTQAVIHLREAAALVVWSSAITKHIKPFEVGVSFYYLIRAYALYLCTLEVGKWKVMSLRPH